MLKWACLFIFLPVLVLAGQQDTLRGVTAIFDTYISEADSVTNYGAATVLRVDKTASSQKRLMISVDSASLAALQNIWPLKSGRLWLWCESQVGATLELSEGGKPLKEALVTWNGWSGADSNWSEFGANNTGTISAAAQNRGKWAHFRDERTPTTGYEYWDNVEDLADQDSNWTYGWATHGTYSWLQGYGFALPTGSVIDTLWMANLGSCHDLCDNDCNHDDSYLRFMVGTGQATSKGDSVNVFKWNPYDPYVWYYWNITDPDGFGFPTSPTWGVDWTANEINSPTFGMKYGKSDTTDTGGGCCGVDSLWWDKQYIQVSYDADTALDRSDVPMSSVTVTQTGWVGFYIDLSWLSACYTGEKHCYSLFVIATDGNGETVFTSSEGAAEHTPMITIWTAPNNVMIRK